jgi:hypothetical protein
MGMETVAPLGRMVLRLVVGSLLVAGVAASPWQGAASATSS